MRVSKLSRRLAPVLVLGMAYVTAGCSPEPVAEQVPNGQIAVESHAQAVSVITSPPAPATATPAPAAKARLTVEGEGLRWFLEPTGSARPIPFGRLESEVLASLEGVRGSGVKGTNQDCGAGPVQVVSWSDRLSLVFQKGRFVGWGLGQGADGNIDTAAGIGPGSTRAELEAAYNATVSQTSLGSEFNAGELHGVLDGASAGARITDMWAGVSCIAR